MKRIKIASGDTGYTIVFQLLDLETGRPMNLSEDGTVASFHFVGVAGEIFHQSCVAVNACLGLVSVEWPPVGLLDPGLYDGIFRVLFANQKAVTIQRPIPFEIVEAVPCVAGTSSPIHSPPRWNAATGNWMVANSDHPNVWHSFRITGDPDNPTIDIGNGEVFDGSTI